MKKRLHIVVLGYAFLFSFLFWVRGRDLLEWAMHAPLWQMILLQCFNAALSSVILVDLLGTVIKSCERCNQRQRLRAVLYTWGIVFVASSAMMLYGRMSVHRIVP
jgi:hypothetical protein